MEEPIRQHYVSKGYLTPFRDPSSDTKNPLIWIFKKDGSKPRLDKIENVLLEKHIYTLKMHGKNDYVIERTLNDLEGEYGAVFHEKIEPKKPLNEEERSTLCLFAAVMLQRTRRYKHQVESFLDDIISNVQAMEKGRKIPPKQSSELLKIKQNFHKTSILENAPAIAQVFMQMNLAFLCTDGKSDKFITSDDPCNSFNSALQMQPYDLGRGGLSHKDVQVTLPLSPDIMMCLTRVNMHGYVQMPRDQVQEQNRMTRGFAYEYFVAHSRTLKRSWFRQFPLDPTFLARIFWRRFLPRGIDKMRRIMRNAFWRD